MDVSARNKIGTIKAMESCTKAFYSLLRICYSKCGPQPTTQAIPGRCSEKQSPPHLRPAE